MPTTGALTGGRMLVVTDKNGNSISATIANTICPAAYINEARVIASEHMRDVERVADWQQDWMLGIKLSPTGEGPVTHYWCYMQSTTDQVERIARRIAAATNIGSPSERSLSDTLTDKFLVCQGDPVAFLRAAQLQIVR